MNINEIILQEDKSFVMSVIKKIFGGSKEEFKRKAQDAIDYFLKRKTEEEEILDIINKHFGTNYKSLKDIKNLPMGESNEGFFTKLWNDAKGSAWGAFSFLPILNAFIEMDKLFRGNDGNVKMMAIYLLMWAAVMAAKAGKDALGKHSQNHMALMSKYADNIG